MLVDAGKDEDSLFLSSPDNRGVDGTANVAHTAGALVGVFPIAAHWRDINDRVDAVQSDVDLHNHDGSDTVQIALQDITGHSKAAHSDFDFVPVATVLPFAGSSVPPDFLECNGQEVSRVTFDALFSEIGTTYGAGDGSSTFAVPDMRDVFAIGSSATKAIGATGGTETHTHTNPSADSAGSHTHGQSDSGSAGSHAHSQSNTGSNGNHRHTNPPTHDAGNHGHSGVGWRTGSVSDHAHTNPNTSTVGDHDHGMGGSGNNTFVQDGSGDLVPNDEHTHNIFGGGGHAHSVGNTGSNGGHDHNLTATNSAGTHDHNQANTGANGSHAHSNPNVNSNGSHAHSNPTTDSAGSHAHTQADTGSTSNVPPWLSLMFIIKAA